MHGTTTIPFRTLFIDTLATHGTAWAQRYYTSNGMQAWEFRFWLRSCWKDISTARAAIAVN